MNKEIISHSEENSSSDARKAGESLINHYAATAIWPSESEDHVKSIILRLTNELSELYDRDIISLSLDDLERSQAKIKKLLVFSGVSKLRLSSIMKSIKMYEDKRHYVDMLSYLYSTGSAMTGNFSPVLRKLGLGVSGAPLARATGVWFAGQVLLELYIDEEGYKRASKRKEEKAFDPIFDSFNLEQLRELACYLDIDPKVKWDDRKLREEILSVLASSYHNKIQGLMSDMPSYKSILLNLASELKLPEYGANDKEEELEEKIVRKIFAENTKDISPEKLESYRDFIKANTDDSFWGDGAKAAAMTGALVVGGRLTSGSMFVAGSSLLMAFRTGVGISTAYTGLSAGLSALFGPASIGISGVYLAAQLTRSRPRKALPFVLYMAVMRSRIDIECRKKLTFRQKLKGFLRRS